VQRHMLKSKIHRATVTACDPDYAGSITVDPERVDSHPEVLLDSPLAPEVVR
jgi:aspartate 1-decarboxylase